MSAARCFVCSVPVPEADDHRGHLCESCAPARDHVVSMHRIGLERAATCRCGWHFQGLGDERDRAVRKHWRSVVEGVGV